MFYITAARLQSVSSGEGPINPIVVQQDNTVFGFTPFCVVMGKLYDGLQGGTIAELERVPEPGFNIKAKESKAAVGFVLLLVWLSLKSAAKTNGLCNRGADRH